MKKIIILSLFLIVFSWTSAAQAHGAEDSSSVLSADEIIKQISEEQGVAGAKEINCQKISDHQFEELGDAVMSLRHPDPQEHAAMDQMMGGEGSKSLQAAHIMMGRGYLGCYDQNFLNVMGGGMMGGGMMGSAAGQSSAASMMGGFNSWGNFTMILAISLWIFIILGIIWLIKNLVAKK